MPKKAILAGPTRRPNLPPVLREMPVLLVILGSTACFSETAAKDDSIAGRDTGQETDADTDADTDTDTDTDTPTQAECD